LNQAPAKESEPAESMQTKSDETDTVAEKPKRPRGRPRRSPKTAKTAVSDSATEHADENARGDEPKQPELVFDADTAEGKQSSETKANAEPALISESNNENQSNDVVSEGPMQAQLDMEPVITEASDDAAIKIDTHEAPDSSAKINVATPYVRGALKRFSHPMTNPASVEMPAPQEYSAMSDDSRGSFVAAGKPAVLSSASSKASAPMATPPSS